MTRRDFSKAIAGVGLLSPYATAAEPWLRGTFRELHIDAHFSQLPAPYTDFDAGHAASIVKDAGFQMVSVFAICNGGYSYYPTRLGVVHPGLKRDFTGEFTRALKKHGIRVLAYVSVGRERRAFPEWERAPGQMCTNSPWVEEAHIPQLKEIVSMYGVDGFFFDAVLGKFVRGVCTCKWCRAAFGKEIPKADNDPGVFEHYRFLSRSGARYAERVIPALPQGLAYVMNHVWVTHNPVDPPDVLKQVVWEPVPPYPGVLSLDFSLQARYLATLRNVDNWSCMATRGNGWGDYSLRDTNTFLHEAATLLASGGRPYFGDDSYPSGNPDPQVYRALGDVNARTAALEPFVRNAKPVPEIAVLLSADSIWSSLPLDPPRDWLSNPSSAGVAGAHKVLVEEHAQFSILNSETLIETLADYKALIVPEQCILSAGECESIRNFVRDGGTLIATGDTGTRDSSNQPLNDFALADVLGVRRIGRADVRRAFLRREMDVQVNGAYQRIALTSARSLVDLVAPGIRQAPSEKAEGPGITIHSFGKGHAIYCSVPLFTAYHQDGTPALRRVASMMLDRILPPEARLVRLENAPGNIEMILNRRGSTLLLDLVNFTGDRRIGGPQRLQEFTTVEGLSVRVRSSVSPKQVSLVPEGRSISFRWKDGWVEFGAAPLRIHSVYAIEV